jgi:hypothetical protein
MPGREIISKSIRKITHVFCFCWVFLNQGMSDDESPERPLAPPPPPPPPPEVLAPAAAPASVAGSDAGSGGSNGSGGSGTAASLVTAREKKKRRGTLLRALDQGLAGMSFGSARAGRRGENVFRSVFAFMDDEAVSDARLKFFGGVLLNLCLFFLFLFFLFFVFCSMLSIFFFFFFFLLFFSSP